MKTLPDLVRQSAARYAAAPALGRVGKAEGLSYPQLHLLMNQGAAVLRLAELAPGERVLLVVEPGPEWVAAFFAILEAGLVAVPLPIETPPPIIAGIAGFAEVRLAIVSSRTQNLLPVLAGIPRLAVERLVYAEGAPLGTSQAGTDLAMLAFTSGSTSRPRAVELTHANLLANLQGLLHIRQAGPGDVFLSMLPPAHLFELLVGLLGPLACGARIVYAGSLLPNRIIAALRTEAVTHALAVPALLDAVYEQVLDELADAGFIDAATRGQSPADTARRMRQEMTPADMDKLGAGVRQRIGQSFHSLVIGGAALNPVWVDITRPLGLRLEIGYGLTEASPIVASGLTAECPAGSVGRPLPGVEVRIDDSGEILVKGPNVMRGYFKDPTATAEVLPGGWLRTGDHGYLDADGFLFITGRLKEAMVTAAGETIYPEEVEPYYSCSLFAEVCVAALPGPQGNDIPTLFVVPATPDVPDEELQKTFDQLRAIAPARCRLPRFIRLAGPLPRTATGKIRRRLVAQTWLQGGMSS